MKVSENKMTRFARDPIGDLPLVLIMGRANAGKSTLFNRIARARAIVSPLPGTTRDIKLTRVSHGGAEFLIADSGGLELGGTAPISGQMAKKALEAAATADVVIFLLDARAGLSPGDEEAFALVRRTGRPLLVAVNKVENRAQESGLADYYRFGVAKIFPVSAAHGRGVEELLDEVVTELPAEVAPTAETRPTRLALLGRPNVGKSSILNRLVGYERMLVDEVPGTTRDAVDVRLRVNGREILLIDTAGMRRKTRVGIGLERLSVSRAIEALRRTEVALLVVDAAEGVTDQDAQLARLAESNGRALVLVCNKWDLAASAGAKQALFNRRTRTRFPFLDFAPLVFCSALTGDGVGEILPAGLAAADHWRAEFQTAELNRILRDALMATAPPLLRGRQLRLMYVTQVASAPPRLVLFANMEAGIPPHYMRFLEGRFRSALHLQGSPLMLEVRRSVQRARQSERGRDNRTAPGREPASPRSRWNAGAGISESRHPI